MTKKPQAPPLVPNQIEILKVLARETMPLERPALYRELSFKNWLGKWLGTPRSPGKYPNSLYERGFVGVEDEAGSPDDKGRNCLFFFITRSGHQALKKIQASKNGKPKAAKRIKKAKKQRFNRSKLEAMTRKDLRILAKKYKVSTTGTKGQMLDRFMTL